MPTTSVLAPARCGAQDEGCCLCHDTEETFAPELLEQVRDLELQGVSAAESGDVSTALERFNEAIRLLPERASGYNNRAQALRLKGDVAGKGYGARQRGKAPDSPSSPPPFPLSRCPAGLGHRHPPGQGLRPCRLPELRAAGADPPAAGPR